MKKQFEEFGCLESNPNIEIIEYKNKFYCLSGWNGERYFDCWECDKPFWFNGKYSANQKSNEKYTFTPIYNYQIENIDLETIEENSDEWLNAVEIVDFDIQ